jgi:acetyl esterase/lipase
VGRAFRALSATGALLTLNALRPLPGQTPLSVPSFFGGWLAAELAPHNLAVTVIGSAVHVSRHGLGDRGDRVALALNAGSVAGLSAVLLQALRTRHVLEDALRTGLGDDYVALLDPAPDRVDLATPWRQVAMPFRVKHPAVRRVADVQYHGNGSRHRLDIYTPREPGTRRPVLLQIHGGAWSIGHKGQQGIPLMTHLAARGWVCVAPNYRLSPRAAWPEHLIDLKRALAWVRENIEAYGGDPSFVAVTGGSAGGHLAAMLALTGNDPRYQPGFPDVDTTVQACVPHYGVYDFANTLGTKAAAQRRDYFLAPFVVRRNPRTDLAVFEEASPLLLVGPDAPPFFVLHGAHDSLVPVAEAVEFVQRLRGTSRSPVVYAELPGAQHAFDIFPSVRSAHVVRAVERFLRWVHARHASVRAQVSA